MDGSTITLTTDFGETDPYVASMKGVLTKLAPGVPVLDLSHAIPPQEVFEAALFLAGCVPWFPAETVHVVVVDPGVGTERMPIAVRWRGQLLVGPDNGVFTMLARKAPFEGIRRIEHPECRMEPVSATFHGRDVFAPTGAKLAMGMPFETIGAVVVAPVMLCVPEPKRLGNVITGEVIHIDRFGNTITNISDDDIKISNTYAVTVGSHSITGIMRTYGEAPQGAPLALIGSGGFLEIAVNQGNAHRALGLNRGMPVYVET